MTNTKTIVTALALGAALALSGCGTSEEVSGTTQPQHDIVPFDAPPIDEATKQAYLDAVNAARSVGRNCGDTYMPPAPPLQWSDALYRAAYEHSQDMAATGVLTHDGSGTETDWTAIVWDLGRGSVFNERIKNNGASMSGSGENIALVHNGGTQYVINGWLNSPGHCMNLMSPVWKYVGMARVGTFWTQDFSD